MGERLRGWAARQTKSPHLWLVAVTTAVFSDMLDVWDGVDVRQKGAGSGAWDNSCGGEEWENKESVLVVVPPPPSNVSVVTRPNPPLPFIKININTHPVRIDTPTSSLWTSEELPARSAPNYFLN